MKLRELEDFMEKLMDKLQFVKLINVQFLQVIELTNFSGILVKLALIWKINNEFVSMDLMKCVIENETITGDL